MCQPYFGDGAIVWKGGRGVFVWVSISINYTPLIKKNESVNKLSLL